MIYNKRILLLKFVNNYIIKRSCILLYISKLKELFKQKSSFSMHNPKTNFDKIFNITKSFFSASINVDGNFKYYPGKSKMSDSEIITISILCKSISNENENCFFSGFYPYAPLSNRPGKIFRNF